ncbi:insulin-like peptide INSL5 [Elgaria multicarinata webbii]|uniref:insulin-like peptide INSL5 n=1 Tax=Elgaria multicarinata webbii TaxID=159646 RepID=UPI002FCD5F35
MGETSIRYKLACGLGFSLHWLSPSFLPWLITCYSCKMKAMALGLLSLSLLMAAFEVKSEGSSVKLCGRDFVRAVVFTCGGSRWRRQLTDFPENLRGAEEKYIENPDAQSKEFIQSISETERDLRGKERKSIQKRHEDVVRLTVSCCTVGCSESSIGSLC